MEKTLVLVSRFNLPHPVWNDRSHEEYQEWVQGRLKLIADLTIPSIRNCYDKPDRWLIMIDTRKIDFEDELREMTKGLPVQLVKYRGINLVSSIREALADLSFPRTILTCRLDTDDLAAASLFKGYRNADITADDVEAGIVLSYAGGAIYSMEEDQFYLSIYPDNPFLCYAEHCNAADELKTVFHSQHPDLIKNSPRSLFLRSFVPQWASVVHGENLANDSLRNLMRCTFNEKDALRKAFGLNRASL